MKKSLLMFLVLLFFLLYGCKSISNNPEIELVPFTVILSFDDGPNIHGDTTARLLDVLKKYEITAMFALLGDRAEAYPELVRRIYDEGHYIINHGYSDKWSINMGESAFLENLRRGETAISLALGKEFNPRLYRPHGGFYNSLQERIILDEGYIIIPCNIRVYDAFSSERDRNIVVNRVISETETKRGGIILLHDSRDSISLMERKLLRNPDGIFNRTWIPDAVEEIIITLLEKGYTIGNPALVISDF